MCRRLPGQAAPTARWAGRPPLLRWRLDADTRFHAKGCARPRAAGWARLDRRWDIGARRLPRGEVRRRAALQALQRSSGNHAVGALLGSRVGGHHFRAPPRPRSEPLHPRSVGQA
jgi:hypothetical protein